MSDRVPFMQLGLIPQTDEAIILRGETKRKNKITSIRVNNTIYSAYTVWLYLVKRGDPEAKQLITTYQLDAGDIICDDTPFELVQGMELWAKSNVDTASFTINGYTESSL